MTNAEWAVVRPSLLVPGWMRGRVGQPEAYCHRAMLDAIRYLVGKWHQVAGSAGRLPALGVSTRSSAADVTTAW
ncbi:hypothetical protein [Streptomyces mirabilis]|uniref:hypothetical protein n=1 Tax=Streptomyces mirabilis TaxID=68239 RepID=UPI003677FAFC